MERINSAGELITQHKEVFKKLAQCGLVSCSVITHYQMYQFYKGLDPSLPKMERYQQAAERFGVDVRTVKRAIKKMEG